MARRVHATVDDREPDDVVDAVREHPDVAETTVSRLDAGDVVVGSTAIERKTLRDYVTSVMGRAGSDLEDQVDRMADRYDNAYVLVEGDMRDVESLRTGIAPEAIRGSMASITARTAACVVPCSDRPRLVDYAIRLGRKHVEAPSTRPLPPGSLPSRREPTAKRMYACIEGIGPELAGNLYEAYPTVAEIAAASRDELLDVDGVGEARARAISSVLRDRTLE